MDMSKETIRFKRQYYIIILMGYLSFVITLPFVFIQSIVDHEFPITFPIVYATLFLGITTPIVYKVIIKKIYIVLQSDGFIASTLFHKSNFISWSDVESMVYSNFNGVVLHILKDNRPSKIVIYTDNLEKNDIYIMTKMDLLAFIRVSLK